MADNDPSVGNKFMKYVSESKNNPGFIVGAALVGIALASCAVIPVSGLAFGFWIVISTGLWILGLLSLSKLIFSTHAFQRKHGVRVVSPVRPADAMWLLENDVNNMYINAILIHDKIDVPSYRSLIMEKGVGQFAHLRDRLVFVGGTAHWQRLEADDFNIEHHVVHAKLSDSSGEVSEAQLKKYVESQWTKPLPAERPLWQYQVIENFEGGRSATLFRVHHCYADGISLMQYCLAGMETANDSTAAVSAGPKASPNEVNREDELERKQWKLDLIKALRSEDQTEYARLLKQAKNERLLNLLKQTDTYMEALNKVIQAEKSEEEEKTPNKPDSSLEKTQPPKVGLPPQSLARMLIAAVKFPIDVAQMFFVTPNESPLHGSVLTGTRHVDWSDPIPLDKVKDVKNALGVTVNDVVISCLSGALRSYVQENNGGKEVKDMIMNVPVSLRREVPKGTLNNYFSVVWVDTYTSIADPKERVLATARHTSQLKQGFKPMGNFFMINLMGHLLPQPVQQFLFEFLARKTTGVMTNVPGPQSTLFYGGRKIHQMMFWVPSLANIGLGCSIISYNGSVRVGVTVDSALCMFPSQICEHFVREFGKLSAVAMKK